MLAGIRQEAWQIVQENSIARWWFLKNRLPKNPFYSTILGHLRNQATVLDVGCGFGQELRFLRNDGANGKMWTVDYFPKMWELGLKLSQDAPGPAIFIEADVIHDYSNICPLHSLHERIDIYILNDYLSFLGKEIQEKPLQSIVQASRVGSKIIGLLFGTYECETITDPLHGSPIPLKLDTNIWGGGLGRGVIMHPRAFQDITWKSVEQKLGTQRVVETRILSWEKAGLDASEMSIVWTGFSIEILFFIATREE